MAKKKQKMIYDQDKWLKPYKEVIDRRHKMILDLRDRYSVDGSLSKGLNNHMSDRRVQQLEAYRGLCPQTDRRRQLGDRPAVHVPGSRNVI